ncbi:hypothetical protein PFISCL1PPCAC_4865, partial [Pristionchus fissidentatus]
SSEMARSSSMILFCLSLLLISAHVQGRLFKRSSDDIEEPRCNTAFLHWSTRIFAEIFKNPINCSGKARAVWLTPAPETDAQFHAYCCRPGCSKRHAEEFYCIQERAK